MAVLWSDTNYYSLQDNSSSNRDRCLKIISRKKKETRHFFACARVISLTCAFKCGFLSRSKRSEQSMLKPAWCLTLPLIVFSIEIEIYQKQEDLCILGALLHWLHILLLQEFRNNWTYDTVRANRSHLRLTGLESSSVYDVEIISLTNQSESSRVITSSFRTGFGTFSCFYFFIKS